MATDEVQTAVSKDHPLLKAWDAHKATESFANSRKWATNSDHTIGSLWAVFAAGWEAATERAAALHANINPASGAERLAGSPGADAMGAIIEYRDEIRAPQ